MSQLHSDKFSAKSNHWIASYDHLQRAVDRQPWSPRGWLVETLSKRETLKRWNNTHEVIKHSQNLLPIACVHSISVSDNNARYAQQHWHQWSAQSITYNTKIIEKKKTLIFQSFFNFVENFENFLKPWSHSFSGHRFFPDLSLGMHEVLIAISIYDMSHEDL